MSVWYLDSSAIVKLAVMEAETQGIIRWHTELEPDDVLMTCELAVAEVVRAVRSVEGDVDVALAHLDSLEQLVMDRDLMLVAGELDPLDIRSLDAIHLAAALAAGDELTGIVTYDTRMATAARNLGLLAWAPGTQPPP
ncbi:MAG: type II toxin-antitoxin system VapC family toxin [Actinomycetota bacterium]|nr:type II toxin-antitoxin system VapC family toxin [Actinomycetota bacterium]